MKFHTLTIENFLTIKKAGISLADRGLQLVQGANDDDSSATSNGAGKSSLVDALFWCLYGVTARDVKGDAVVNLAAKKNCLVRVKFTTARITCHVTRHRKHDIGKNTLVLEVEDDSAPGVLMNVSLGTDAETQKRLEQMLGCGREVFTAAVYSGQEAMPDLPRMKDRELKTLIEEAAGLQRIERAYELARTKALGSKGAFNSVEFEVGRLEMEKLELSDRLESARANFENWGALQKEVIEKTRLEVIAAERALDEAEKQLSDATPENIASLNEAADIDAELAAHGALSRRAAEAERLAQDVRNRIDTVTPQRLKEQAEQINAKIANAAEEVKKSCPECGTQLKGMSVEDFVAHQTGHLRAVLDKLEAAKLALREGAARLKTANDAAAAARAAVPDVSALSGRRAVLHRTLEGYAQKQNAARRSASELSAARDRHTMRTSEPNPHEKLVEWQKKTLAETTHKLAKAHEKLAAAKEQVLIDAGAAKLFGPAGVRAQILDSVTPFLNARAADYLSALSDGQIQAIWTTLTRSAAGELKEKFSIDVTHAKGGDSFAALSGGEKRKVRLACALALQDLVASRASQPIDMWIGDEIDDALDPAGLERLMTILERKARERGTVLVISHSDLKDWVDQVTIVRKTGLWQSTIEGALCS